MFLPNGDVDFAFYYSELTKAKSERIKWFVIGILTGATATLAVLWAIRLLV